MDWRIVHWGDKISLATRVEKYELGLEPGLGDTQSLHCSFAVEPVLIWHAPGISGLVPKREFIPVEVMYIDPVFDDIAHVIPDALLRMSVVIRTMCSNY